MNKSKKLLFTLTKEEFLQIKPLNYKDFHSIINLIVRWIVIVMLKGFPLKEHCLILGY